MGELIREKLISRKEIVSVVIHSQIGRLLLPLEPHSDPIDQLIQLLRIIVTIFYVYKSKVR